VPKQINAANVTRGNTYFIPPEELILKDGANSRRFETTDETELALDILDNGQKVPIICRRDENGRPVVADGHRRVRAIRYLNAEGLHPDGLLKARCEVMDTDDDKTAFLTSIKTFMRKDQSPVDQAYSISRLETFGLTRAEISKAFGRSQSWVSKVQKISGLPVKVQKQIHAGEISLEAAYELAGLPPAKAEEAVAEAGVEGKPTAATVQRTKRQAAEKESGDDEDEGKGKKAATPGAAQRDKKPVSKMRTLKEIRLFFIDLDNAVGAARGPVEEFAGDFLKYMDGRLSDTQIENRLRKLAEG
jgi:ParB/RepB/Spo0J family partition protein